MNMGCSRVVSGEVGSETEIEMPVEGHAGMNHQGSLGTGSRRRSMCVDAVGIVDFVDRARRAGVVRCVTVEVSV
jgi:hypothetical protein